MQKGKANRAVFTLVISIAVLFSSLFTARMIEAGGGSVDVDRLSVEMNGGALLSAKLWRPNRATPSNPAPAVVLIPGGNANLEYMSSVSLELARRGYVALAIDPYTIGRSDVVEPTPDLGASAALSYIKQLDFVNTDAIGMVGWSAGVGRMNAAALQEDGTSNGVKALFGFGAGSPGDPELEINQGYFIGKIETTYGFGVAKQSDINTAEAFTKGMQTDYVEFGTWYGDLTSNKGRILYTGLTGHILGLVSGSGISAACNFFNDALAPAPNGNVSNYVFGWKELSTALAMVALIVIMITAGSLLLKTSFFSTVCKSEDTVASAKPNALLWGMLALTILFGALIAKWAVFNGQQMLNKIQFLQISNVNGFVFWLLCLTVFSVLLFALRVLLDKKLDRATLFENAKLSMPNILKSLMLGLTIILIGYFLVSLGDQFFSISPRFWKIQLNILYVQRFGLWLIYLPLYFIALLTSGFIQSSAYFMKDKPKLFTALVWASNTLPALFFVLYVYGTIIFTGLTPITSAAMSRANGSMLDALLLMLPVSFITSYFYRKTKNIYVGAFLNSMLFTWIAVGTDLITYIQ